MGVQATDIFKLILGLGFVLALIGVGLGTHGIAGTNLLASLLFE